MSHCGQNRKFSKRVYAGKCLNMSINISSAAGKHLKLGRHQQGMAPKGHRLKKDLNQQCNRDVCHIFRSGSTSENQLLRFKYYKYLPETPVLDGPVFFFSFIIFLLVLQTWQFSAPCRLFVVLQLLVALIHSSFLMTFTDFLNA